MKSKSKALILSIFIIVILSASCCPPYCPIATTAEPYITPTITPTPPPPLAPEPVSITAYDGVILHGYYYHAETRSAPLVVMMHSKFSDMSDWYEVAPWLQNRGQHNILDLPEDARNFSWWNPDWFPPVPADQSYAVLIFSFRDCYREKGGCVVPPQDKGFYRDIETVMLFARELDGVDPNRIVTIGADIGANGAAYGCQFLNGNNPDGPCKGTFALSPDSINLERAYSIIIGQMGELYPPTRALCLSDPSDTTDCQSVNQDINSAYVEFIIPNGGHGIEMIHPDLHPLPLEILLKNLDSLLY